MKILSLFDGISCARVALERAGIKVQSYYSSEIDKYAIQISEKNYPDIHRLGTVLDVGIAQENSTKTYIAPNCDIDLLIGGSPCQDLSIAKKDRKGLDGERSGLFWEYVRILNEVKPKYFILENVNSMPKEAKELITKTLGVEPIMINAALVSAQNRKRLFWTNIPNVTQPEDRNIKLSDIIETNVDECFQYRRTYWRKNKSGKIPTLTSNMGTGGNNVPYVFDVYNQKIVPNNKAKTLGTNPQCATAVAGQLLHVVALTETRTEEAKRIRSEHYKKTGKDWSPRFEKELVPRRDEKANTITTGNTKESLILENMTVRKLTPIECERLQGLPEIEKSCIIKVCLGNQNNPVNVVTQNLKSQCVVGSVGKSDLNESVLSAKKSLNINNPQIDNVAEAVVLINCEENKVEIHSQGKLLANVSGAELKSSVPHLKSIGDFVHLVVGLNTIVGKTTPFGKAELPQKSSLLVIKESGNNVVNIYGKGITQLAEDARIDSITLNKLLKFTTSDLSTQENKEQLIQTLFSYVVLAILGYIPKEIRNQNTLTFQIKSKVGYTFGISNTQRYKCLGNAFNVDVVAHILSFIPC